MYVADNCITGLPTPPAFTSDRPMALGPYWGARVPVAQWQEHLPSLTSVPCTQQVLHGCWSALSLRSLCAQDHPHNPKHLALRVQKAGRQHTHPELGHWGRWHLDPSLGSRDPRKSTPAVLEGPVSPRVLLLERTQSPRRSR